MEIQYLKKKPVFIRKRDHASLCRQATAAIVLIKGTQVFFQPWWKIPCNYTISVLCNYRRCKQIFILSDNNLLHKELMFTQCARNKIFENHTNIWSWWFQTRIFICIFLFECYQMLVREYNKPALVQVIAWSPLLAHFADGNVHHKATLG